MKEKWTLPAKAEETRNMIGTPARTWSRLGPSGPIVAPLSIVTGKGREEGRGGGVVRSAVFSNLRKESVH